MIRHDVVNSIVLTLASDAPAPQRIREVEALGATAAEKRAAGELLAASAVEALIAAGVLMPESKPSMLSLSYHDMRRLGWQGLAMLWLADQLPAWPSWPSWPGTPFSSMLKTERRERLAYFARELHRVGLCDLCEHEAG